MSSNTFYALLSVALVVLIGFLMLSFSTVNRNGEPDPVTDLRVIDLTPQTPARSTTNIDVSPSITTPSPAVTEPIDDVDEVSSTQTEVDEVASE